MSYCINCEVLCHLMLHHSMHLKSMSCSSSIHISNLKNTKSNLRVQFSSETMENDPNNIVTGDLIKGSARRAKEQELESEIAYKEKHYPKRSDPGGRRAENNISALKREIAALKNSDEMKVLLRIVDQGTKPGKVLISLVQQMNEFRHRNYDYMEDDTLESTESLAAKRLLVDYLTRPKQHHCLRLEHHQRYVIELRKYKVELLEMSMLQTAKLKEEARHLIHIFNTEAGEMTTRQRSSSVSNAKQSVEKKRKREVVFDKEFFIQLRARAIKELNERGL